MTPEVELGRKMDALGLWKELSAGNFAIRPRGTVYPYFCTVYDLNENGAGPLKLRFMMLEGWQTLHDFLRTRVDSSFGFYSSPMEMPHFEMLVLKNGACKVFRHDIGLVPREIDDKERALVVKLLWESYGIMMRLESDAQLMMKYADLKSVFSRVEGADGKWSDAPLEVIQPRPHVESVSFPAAELKKAADLPFDKDFAISVDFRLNPGVVTSDNPPKCVYELVGVSPSAAEKPLFRSVTSVVREAGLKGMWEAMPIVLLKHIIGLGKVPGSIRTRSQRVFRLIRPLAVELPFRLSFHDRLPELENVR